MKLDAAKFGLAFGIMYGIVFFVIGLVAALFGWGGEFFRLLGKFYFGFGPTLPGAFIGAAWGLGVGFLFFGVAAAIYNSLLKLSGGD